jgi:hypothetical protein
MFSQHVSTLAQLGRETRGRLQLGDSWHDCKPGAKELSFPVVVQFEGGDSYQGMPSGVPQKPPRMPALAAVTAKASG